MSQVQIYIPPAGPVAEALHTLWHEVAPGEATGIQGGIEMGEPRLVTTPDAVIQASAAPKERSTACDEARNALIQAGDAYDQAREAYDQAEAAYNQAREAYHQAREAYSKAKNKGVSNE